MNILTPSIPAPYRITDTMWQDLICDPVMACEILLGYKLDAFQAARLRFYWWFQEVIDSSGVGSGKTIVDWCFIALRCILLPEQHAGVYYPIFETGKGTFWKYFRDCKSPLFHAQLGRTDEKGDEDGDGKVQGAACFKAYYKNGSLTSMPAPSFMKNASTQASLRFNTILFEEYTQIDKSSKGIDEQLISRALTPSWNKNHPIWGNHLVFTAHAESRMHPSWPRYSGVQAKIKKGDPRCACITFNYKDYSNLICHTGKTYRAQYRDDTIVAASRTKKSAAEWLAEGFGIWAVSGTGWFTEQALLQCIASGKARGVVPVLSRRQLEEARN